MLTLKTPLHQRHTRLSMGASSDSVGDLGSGAGASTRLPLDLNFATYTCNFRRHCQTIWHLEASPDCNHLTKKTIRG